MRCRDRKQHLIKVKLETRKNERELRKQQRFDRANGIWYKEEIK
jgi:hypothetical protein